MNSVILMGRLTGEPEIRHTPDGKAVGTYTLAVDRRFAKGDQKADFIRCQCWEKKAEFAEKYLTKGIKIIVTGRIQTGSYTNKDGVKVYTTEVVIEEQEFAESKSNSSAGQASFGGENSHPTPSAASGEDFMNIPETMKDELPFG